MASIAVTRLAVSAVAAIGLLATLLLARGRFVQARGPTVILLIAWWLGPVTYYEWRVETLTGAALIGAALLIAGAGLLIQIYRSQGSTASVGLLLGPLLIWVPLVLLVELDRVLAS